MPSYLALARKYRPQVFEDIVGQEHVTRTLQRAIEGGRIHHAYLFTGIRGIGKTTCARVLAKALNCKLGPTSSPCNECVSCVEITAGRSMDVMEIDAASNRGIDDIRELREGVRYATTRDRYKIIIIDEVHMLTEQAFNALLKTLEEPPAHVRFILATTDPQKIPATILSRCQRFDFRRVPVSSLVAHLQKVCAEEGVESEEEALAIIARQTQGSVRDSLSLLDQLIAAAEGKVTAAFAREILGVADRQWVLDVTAAIVTGDAKKALVVLSDVFMSGYDVRLFIGEVLEMLRNAMVLAVAGKNRELVDLSESELGRLVEIIKGRNPFDLQCCLRTMLEAAEQMRHSEFPLFAAEEALVRAASTGQTVQIPVLVRRLVELEQRLAQIVPPPSLFKSPAVGGPRQSMVSEKLSAPGLDSSPKLGPGRTPRVEQGLALTETAKSPELEPAETWEVEPAGSSQLELAETRENQPAEPQVSPQSGDDLDAPHQFPDEVRPSSFAIPLRPSGLKGNEALAASPDKIWEEFLAYLVKRGRPKMEVRLFEKCVLSSLERSTARVEIPSGMWVLLKQHDLAGLLSEFFGRPTRVEYLRSDLDELPDAVATAKKRRRAERSRKGEEALRMHPFVKKGIELFQGELVSVELEEQDVDA